MDELDQRISSNGGLSDLRIKFNSSFTAETVEKSINSNLIPKSKHLLTFTFNNALIHNF